MLKQEEHTHWHTAGTLQGHYSTTTAFVIELIGAGGIRMIIPVEL